MTRFGQVCVRLKVATSTNDIARALAVDGAAEGLMVVAQTQTAGRGQRARQWVSEPGGLYFSLLLRPADWPAVEAEQLAGVGGLAVFRALQRLGLPDLSAKPPNDILCGGRKISGILVEPRIAEGRIEFAVVGIGINVAQTAFPDALNDTAVSCHLAGVGVSPGVVETAVCEELEAVLAMDKAQRLGAWQAACGKVDGG